MSHHHGYMNARRWAAIRRAVFKRDGWRCVTCGKPGRLECDHIVPFQHKPNQDPYAIDGLQTLCRSCHIAKTQSENKRPSPARQRWLALVDELR